MVSTSSLLLANADAKGIKWFFENMDGPGIGVVVILVICSFLSWWAMIGKYRSITNLRARNLQFEQRLRKVPSVLTLEGVGTQNPCAYEFLVTEATQAYRTHRGRIRTQEDVTLCMNHVENGIGRGIGRFNNKYEDKLILLSTLVSGGPFLGLLGTVWGVMLTFSALDDSASISKMAPGVSGALMATLFGLIVAIPATFGYNYLLAHTKLMSTELENFASTLSDRIELELQDSVRRSRERAARDAGVASPAYADEPESPRHAAYEPVSRSRPVTARPVDDEPVRRAEPTSSDFGPDFAGYDHDDAPAPRREPTLRTGTRLREVRSWDEVE